MTDVHLDLLDRVRIAAPCPMRWEDLEGDDVQRHCDRCDLNVTNLSAMTREQATDWVGAHVSTGRACIGFYRREDGTILTRDCPVGLAALRQRALERGSRIAAVIGLFLTGGILFGRGSDAQRSLAAVEPLKSLREWLRPTPPPPPPPRRILRMGIYMPPRPTTTLNLDKSFEWPLENSGDAGDQDPGCGA